MQKVNIHNERMIVGIGETVLDILFRGDQPVAAVPGGSCFNSLISVGRTHTPCCFVGYAGDDRIGHQVQDFLRTNHVDTSCFELRPDEKSALSLAHLDEQGDAHYTFYKNPPRANIEAPLPRLKTDDVLMMSSYYAICPGVHEQVAALLDEAQASSSIVYYDLNFRMPHRHELPTLLPIIESNFRACTVVRGSTEDLEVIYGHHDAVAIYRQHIQPLCPYFICTAAAGDVTLCTPTAILTFPTPRLDHVVSTVGAGDSFNAGFCCALVRQGVRKADFATLTPDQWQQLLAVAISFAGQVCQTTENYIDPLQTLSPALSL